MNNFIWWFLINFCLKLKFKERSLRVYKSPWNILRILLGNYFFVLIFCWILRKSRYVLLRQPKKGMFLLYSCFHLLNLEQPFCVKGAQVSNCLFKNGFCIFFLLKCIKYKHILSKICKELHLMVPVSLSPKSLVYGSSCLCLKYLLKKGVFAFSLLIFN